jgi:hypothetical protein
MKSVRHALIAAALVPLAAISLAAAPGDDKVSEIVTLTRAALGGQKVEAVQTLAATGEFRRLLGERELNGELTVEMMVPGRLKRTEEMGIAGGPTFVRVAALDGETFWEDATNRGGGPGMMMRFGGPGGQPPSEADRERFRQMQQRRLQGELARYMVAWLMRTDEAAIAYAGQAEAEDGKAEVLQITPKGGQPMQLFIDAETHLPLMLSYKGNRPRMVMRQAGAPRPDPEEVRRRMAEPPQEVTYELRFSDYKAVDGVTLPHQMTQSVDGKATEEWTIGTFKVNPALKPETFVKK